MDITANQSVKAKEPWWKVLMSFGSISNNDAEENEINEIVQQQDSKRISQLENIVSDVGTKKSMERKTKASNSIDMQSKKLKQKMTSVNDKEKQDLTDDKNELIR